MKLTGNKKPLTLSIVIPVYNAELLIDESFLKLNNQIVKLIKDSRIDNWEAIFIDNGSNDKTLQKLRQIGKENKQVVILHLEERGFGLALRTGLKNAKGDLVYFTAVDHPFDFQDLDNFLNKIDKSDIIYASKNNSKSVYQAPFKRKFASFILSNTVKILFNLPLTDTQGTFIVKQDALKKVLPFCNSPGAFIQAQLAINAKRFKFSIGEIPIEYYSKSGSSSFSLFRDGLNYLLEALEEKLG